MSLFNTQKKKVGNATAGEEKLPVRTQKVVATKKVVKPGPVAKVTKTGAVTQSEKRAAAAQGISFPKGSAVIKPRVTEKAGLLSQAGIYTFEVRTDANIKQISAAITAAYKVTPVRINIAPIKSKAMFVRGRKGKTVAGKKAYVTLKKGETIEFI